MKLGVLVSGFGSNLQAVLDAVKAGQLPAEVRVVISNKPGVVALERAERAGVPALAVPHKDFDSREAFDAKLLELLEAHAVDWVLLAGFMRVLSPLFLRAFPGRIVNIHPSLLPAFPGAHAQRDALAYGVKLSGCSVHFVDDGVDTGPIIAQRSVPVLDGDDQAALSARILEQEHAVLVEVLRDLAQGRVELVKPDPRGRARVVRRAG